MAKVKYYYDPDTLSYRKIEPKPWVKRRNRTILILSVLSILFLGWKLMYNNLFPYAIILEDVPFSKHKLQLASDHIDNVTKILDSVQEHIDKLEHGALGIKKNIEDSAWKHNRIEFKIIELNSKVVKLETKIKEKNTEISDLKKRYEALMAGGKQQIEANSYFNYHIQRQWKVIIVIFTVIFGTIINIGIQKYFSRKREQRAFELAAFKKEEYDNGYQKVQKEWKLEVKELVEMNKLKISNIMKSYEAMANDYGNLYRNHDETKRIALSLLNHVRKNVDFKDNIGFDKWPGNLQSLLHEMITKLEAE